MKELFDQVSQTCSKQVTHTYSTSFSMAVKMLSPSIQGPIHAIYGFVRLADEIVDSFHDYEKELLLDEFEKETYKAIERKISLNPVLHSFQEVVRKYNISHELVKAFLSSMRADLNQSNYEQRIDYENYIYGSADVVGLMCLCVFVNGDMDEYNRLKAPAMKLGSAFQKVNFLRDLKDDTELLKRSYFPHLANRGIDSATKNEIIREIEIDFEEALVGIKQLPLVAKFGVYTAYLYYRNLLSKLKRTEPEKLLSTRVRISNPLKLALLVRSFLVFRLNLI